MSTHAQAKNIGYMDSNQNQSPESTRFTSSLNQADVYHVGNDSAVAHDAFVWNIEDQASLIIPASTNTASTISVIPAGLTDIFQSDNPSLLTQYFESTLGDTTVPMSSVAPVDAPPVSQGDVDSLISGGSVLSE